MTTILKGFGIDEKYCVVELLTSGLINKTWKVTSGADQFILQSINSNVFKERYKIAENTRRIADYLAEHNRGYLFVAPLKTVDGKEFFIDEKNGYLRLFPFVKGSHTIEAVSTPEQAFESAWQFGKFTKLLSGFNASDLNITIPDFHNLVLRYGQYQQSVTNGNKLRIKRSQQIIKELESRKYILDLFIKIQQSNVIKSRVTHHDTKISNVLFNEDDKGICVIDLDTVMPGYFISDLGDMIRTYVSPANEEEQDFNKIEVREDFFRAVIHGYLSSMGDELLYKEKEFIFYSGLFLVYMQAIRFITDHFYNDVYYKTFYDDHNLVRACNQLCLLKKLEENREVLQHIISAEL